MTLPYIGSTFALYGASGSGKTTQAGEYAKYVARTRGKKTLLYSCDRGGYKSIEDIVQAGLVLPKVYDPSEDPWMWMNDATTVKDLSDIGLIVYDSATSLGEILLQAAAYSPNQMGQQKTQKFTVSNKAGASLQVALNNEAHYGLVQQFWLHHNRIGSYFINKGIDVLWTFAEQRSEAQDMTNVLGPKFVGKALTATLPKEFNYTFRLEAIPGENGTTHRLYLKAHQEFAGLGHAFANARYPLGADTPLPTYVEPADMGTVFALFDQGQKEAKTKAEALFAGMKA